MVWYRKPIEKSEPKEPKPVGRKPKTDVEPFKVRKEQARGRSDIVKLQDARKSIHQAENLFRYYSQPHVNPLNLESKNLCEEANACWRYIFSTRGYDESDAQMGYTQSDREKAFFNADEIVFALECYTQWIRNQNFVREFERPDESIGYMPIVPNQSNLARWLGISSYSISHYMKDDAEAQSRYKRILADCLSEGAMAGIYQPVSTIFSLKNLCDWADKYEDRSRDRADDLGVAEAAELMKQLGYYRERATLEPPKPLLEGDVDG